MDEQILLTKPVREQTMNPVSPSGSISILVTISLWLKYVFSLYLIHKVKI
jgi:hypothetical protein